MNAQKAWEEYCFRETGIRNLPTESSPFGRGFLEGWNAAIREAIDVSEGNEKIVNQLHEREIK